MKAKKFPFFSLFHSFEFFRKQFRSYQTNSKTQSKEKKRKHLKKIQTVWKKIRKYFPKFSGNVPNSFRFLRSLNFEIIFHLSDQKRNEVIFIEFDGDEWTILHCHFHAVFLINSELNHFILIEKSYKEY